MCFADYRLFTLGYLLFVLIDLLLPKFGFVLQCCVDLYFVYEVWTCCLLFDLRLIRGLFAADCFNLCVELLLGCILVVTLGLDRCWYVC